MLDVYVCECAYGLKHFKYLEFLEDHLIERVTYINSTAWASLFCWNVIKTSEDFKQNIMTKVSCIDICFCRFSIIRWPNSAGLQVYFIWSLESFCVIE